MNKRYGLIVLVSLIVLTGCATSENIPASEAPVASPQAIDTMPPPMPSNDSDPAAQVLIRQAQSKLAQKLGIDANNIFVFSVETVEWPDASLGCPQAGVSYTQGITPGYQILLEADGQVYTFHTDETDQVILCSARGPDEIYNPP